MKTEIFPESLTTKKAKLEREKIAKFIDYFYAAKGVPPEKVSVTKDQMKTLISGLKVPAKGVLTIKLVELREI